MFAGIREKHGKFVSSIYTISFYIGMFLAFLNWLRMIFDSLRSGDFFAFVIAIVFQTVLMALYALIFAAIAGTVGLLLLFIPYLIIRGASK